MGTDRSDGNLAVSAPKSNHAHRGHKNMKATTQRDVRGKRRAARQGTASLGARLWVGTALAGVAIPLGLPGLALSADECGAPIGGVVM